MIQIKKKKQNWQKHALQFKLSYDKALFVMQYVYGNLHFILHERND